MRIKPLSDKLSISGQISVQDLPALQSQGIKSIICNRPDFEGVGQPTFSELKTAAEKLGMEARYIPVGFGGVTQNMVDEFAAAVEEMPNPTLAFCLSGARSSMMASHALPRSAMPNAGLAGTMRNLTAMFTGRA